MSSSPPLLGFGRTTSGPAVDQWRAFLIQTGYPVAPTGPWDNAVNHATQDFQASAGLTVDGLVGPQTRAAATARGLGSAAGGNAGGLLTVEPPSTSPSSSLGGGSLSLSSSNSPSASPGSFFDSPAWSGGPSRGRVAGVVGISSGVLLLGVALFKMVNSSPMTRSPAVGAANRLLPDYERDCGC